MPVSYVTLKCDSCASEKFEYIEATKMWRCKYCGAEKERQERTDSMFGIKNVVRQTLIDLANEETDSAFRNLVECQKIDMQYVGTVYARLSYHFYMMRRSPKDSKERSNFTQKMRPDYNALASLGDQLAEDEHILIEELGAPEASAVLLLVFDFLKFETRRDAVLAAFDPSGVYIMNLNAELLALASRLQNDELYDKIIRNTNNLNVKAALRGVLQSYPDGERKAEYIALLVRADNETDDRDIELCESYLRQTADCFETRLAAAMAFCEKSLRPSLACLMETVITGAQDPESVKALFAQLFRYRLDDSEANTVLNYAIQRCTPEVCLYLLQTMQETGQYLSISAKQLSAVLSKEGCTHEQKCALLEACGAFHVDGQAYQGAAAFYLCEMPDPPEARLGMLQLLQSKVEGIATNTVERYLTACAIDREQKPAIVRQLFGGDINRTFYSGIVDKYLLSACDTAEVRMQVLDVLTDCGLKVTTASCVRMLCSSDLPAETRVQLYRRVKAGNPSSGEVMEQYLQQVTLQDFSREIFTELLADAERVADSALRRYVLELSGGAEKPGNVTRLLSLAHSSPGEMNCTLTADGETVSCMLTEAYLLSPPDAPDAAADVARALGASSVSGGDRIVVSGESIKIKKYAAARSKRGTLSASATAICKKFGIL